MQLWWVAFEFQVTLGQPIPFRQEERQGSGVSREKETTLLTLGLFKVPIRGERERVARHGRVVERAVEWFPERLIRRVQRSGNKKKRGVQGSARDNVWGRDGGWTPRTALGRQSRARATERGDDTAGKHTRHAPRVVL